MQFMGIIEDVGSDVKNFKKGDRALASFDMGCGKGFYCQRGLYRCCMINNPENIPCPLYGHKLGAMHGGPLNISPSVHPTYSQACQISAFACFCLMAEDREHSGCSPCMPEV